MVTAVRVLGMVLTAYSAVYVAQYWFSALYGNPQRVWDVLNILSFAVILIALIVNVVHSRKAGGGGALALLYANAALAIWFTHNWIRLLMLEAGETVSVHHDVIWQLIAVLIPLVLTTTGWRLWQARRLSGQLLRTDH